MGITSHISPFIRKNKGRAQLNFFINNLIGVSLVLLSAFMIILRTVLGYVGEFVTRVNSSFVEASFS
jgi:hypothetical protein